MTEKVGERVYHRFELSIFFSS